MYNFLPLKKKLLSTISIKCLKKSKNNKNISSKQLFLNLSFFLSFLTLEHFSSRMKIETE
jgi:hypothetical protein